MRVTRFEALGVSRARTRWRLGVVANAFLILMALAVFVAPAGASAKGLWESGHAATFTAKGSGAVKIVAKASACRGWPVMKVYVDGRLDRKLTLRKKSYTTIGTKKSYASGTHRVRVVMAKDKRVLSKNRKRVVCDRNVWVKSAKMASASVTARPDPRPTQPTAPPTTPPTDGVPGGDDTDESDGARAADEAGALPARERTTEIPDDAVYVSPAGSDSATGAVDAPVRTLAKAVSKAATGGTVVLRGGEYRESVTITKKVTVVGHPGEEAWLDGSSPVTTWAKSGSTWWSTYTYAFDSSPSFTSGGSDGTTAAWQFVNPAYPMAAHPDQVFVDGIRLREVAGLGQVASGTFYVDDAADRLYVGTDPTGHEMRVSHLQKALSVRAADVSLEGFGVRRYATSMPQLGAVTLEKAGDSATDLTIVDNATIGLGVYNEPGIEVARVTSRANGLMGIMGNGAYDLTVDRARVVGNNTERFNSAPAAGGFKITRSRGLTVTDSVFSGNVGTGVWFDQSCHGVEFAGNDVVGNTAHGLFLELSAEAVLADNLVLDNGENGLKINNSGSVDIWNNTVVGNARQINLVQDNRRASALTGSDYDPKRPKPDPTVPWLLQDIRVVNNVVGQGASGGGNCLTCVEDYSHQVAASAMRLSLRGNLYNRPKGNPTWLAVWSKGAGDPYVFTKFADYRSTTGQEAGSASIDGSRVDSDGRLVDGAGNAVATAPLSSEVVAVTGRTGSQLGAWLGR